MAKAYMRHRVPKLYAYLSPSVQQITTEADDSDKVFSGKSSVEWS